MRRWPHQKEKTHSRLAPPAPAQLPRPILSHIVEARDVFILGEELGGRFLLQVALLFGRHGFHREKKRKETLFWLGDANASSPLFLSLSRNALMPPLLGRAQPTQASRSRAVVRTTGTVVMG
jgi:hypothetical protein